MAGRLRGLQTYQSRRNYCKWEHIRGSPWPYARPRNDDTSGAQDSLSPYGCPGSGDKQGAQSTRRCSDPPCDSCHNGEGEHWGSPCSCGLPSCSDDTRHQRPWGWDTPTYYGCDCHQLSFYRGVLMPQMTTDLGNLPSLATVVAGTITAIGSINISTVKTGVVSDSSIVPSSVGSRSGTVTTIIIDTPAASIRPRIPSHVWSYA